MNIPNTSQKPSNHPASSINQQLPILKLYYHPHTPNLCPAEYKPNKIHLCISLNGTYNYWWAKVDVFYQLPPTNNRATTSKLFNGRLRRMVVNYHKSSLQIREKLSQIDSNIHRVETPFQRTLRVLSSIIIKMDV